MNKAVVVYDSAFGNTAEIAKAVGGALSENFDTAILLVGNATKSDLNDVDLLVIGSPTQGGRATKDLQDFINDLPEQTPEGLRFAAFDTRFEIKDHGFGLRVLMKTIGFAAEKIARSLESKGGEQAIPTGGFIVTDKEGPLQVGERERAVTWIRSAIH